MTEKKMTLQEYDQKLTKLESGIDKIDSEISKLSRPFFDAMERDDKEEMAKINHQIAELEAKKRDLQKEFVNGRA